MGVPISNVTRRVVYAASGTGPYNFTFEILAAGDIAVYRDDTLLTLTTNYTVTINSNGTGFVTLTATPTGATQIAIVGNRTISRTTDFVTGGDFFANTLNDELDQQTIFAQQNAEGLQRALQAPQTDPTSINMTLPGRTARANKTLSFDANGNPTPGVSAADVANAVTYATNAANSATAAASSASAASSSASSASSSASTATTQASNASTSATNAANSASAASTSATNATSSASTAATQASNASTSATNAASSASAASTSASNAATSATNASNSASSASTSATNASNSATAAANSATAAAASASSAANTFDSFDDRYLGTKASNPTVDNDGNALLAGALYFSTSENIMKVYDGASWIAATSAGNVSFLRFRYVATSGQTTFSGSDSNSATLTYTVNNVVVFLNGVSLDQTEYTATSGTSVVLGAGAALNDELVIVAFKSFVTADMVPASTGGTYAGAVRFAAGSASVPSISVSGDTNTGIFFPAADTIAFAEGGAEVARFDSAGNFGLGTSLPAGRLHVAGQTRIQDTANAANYILIGSGANAPRGGNSVMAQTSSMVMGTEGAAPLIFITNAAEGMRLDSSGNLGLGVTPVTQFAGYRTLQIASQGLISSDLTSNGELEINNNAYRAPTTATLTYINSFAATKYAQYRGEHRWFTAASGTAGNAITFTQAMTLSTNQGNQPWLGVNITSASFYENFHVSGGTGSYIGRFVNTATAGTQAYGVSMSFANQTPNNTTNVFLNCDDSTNIKAVIYSNGTFGSRTSTYGGISDIKLKQDIIDASSQWDDIKALRIRKFRLKDEVAADPNYPAYIGLVAQEAEQVSPGLVDESPDFEVIETTDEEGNVVKQQVATGTVTKSVKYSILYMKAVKALQEAMTRIETLEAEVQALKGAA